MTTTTLPTTMRAVRIHEYGGPEVLQIEEVPVPEPGPGEVLMRVNAIAVNSWDVRLRSGNAPQVPGRPPVRLPFQPGREAAGEIAAVGEGVTRWRAGQRVVMMCNPSCGKCLYCAKRNTHLCVMNELPGHTKFGAYAEYIVVAADAVIASPDNLTDQQLAPVIWAYGSALHGINLASIEPGEVVLVTGAAGSIGVATIQLARLAGAETVIAVSRSQEKAEQLRALGADDVVNHQDEGSLTQVRQWTNGLGVDVVIDNYGSEETLDYAISAADLGARIVLAATQLDHIDDKLGLRAMPVFAKHLNIIGTRASTQWEQETVVRLAGKGHISMPIAKELPFEEISTAHELQEASAFVGKIVLTL